MTGSKSIAVLLLLVLPFGFASVWRLQLSIDKQFAAVHRERDDLLLRSGRLVKAMSLEYSAFLADVYWTRVVQYFGNKHVRQDTNLELLAPLLDLSTELDPHLLVAYRFGSVFLAEPPPRGAGQPVSAVRLIQRGIAANPDEWRLYQDLGFIYYWELRDYQRASEAFREGSKNPNAGEWMKVMAAKVAQDGRSWSTSMFLWQQIYESTKDDLIRKNAFNHMELIKAEADLEQIDAAIFQFEQDYTRLPAGFGELIRASYLSRQPVDPAGYPYVIDSSGKVRLNPKSPLFDALRRDRIATPP